MSFIIDTFWRNFALVVAMSVYIKHISPGPPA